MIRRFIAGIFGVSLAIVLVPILFFLILLHSWIASGFINIILVLVAVYYLIRWLNKGDQEGGDDTADRETFDNRHGQ